MQDMGSWKKAYWKYNNNSISTVYEGSWYRSSELIAFIEVPKLVQILVQKYPYGSSGNTNFQFLHELIHTASGVSARHSSVVCMS